MIDLLHFMQLLKRILRNLQTINWQNWGKEPYHNAAKYGHLEICKLICSSIQDKNPVDNRGRTPLDIAIASSVKNNLKQEVAKYEKNLKVIHFLIGEKFGKFLQN